MTDKPHTWSEIVAPIVKRYEVGAQFGFNVTYNPAGCAAVGALLKDMARKLDYAVAHKMGVDNPSETHYIPTNDLPNKVTR